MQQGKAEFLDCAECDRPEDACETCPIKTGAQPQPSDRVEFYLNLWRRCKRYETLPDAGGVLDQEERLMRILDLIHAHVDERDAKYQKEQQIRQQAEMKSKQRGM